MDNPKRVVLPIVMAVVVVSLAVGWWVMAKVDEPKFVLETADDACEVRRYDARVVAETHVVGDREQAANEAFRRLAGYIFGGNTTNAKIAMTAPVGQTAEGRKLAMTAPVGQTATGNDNWTVSFTMPEGETLATLPTPDDARVILRELAPTRVAVVKFSGRWTDDSFTAHAEQLRSWLSARGLRGSGEIEVNRYNAPWTPWFLRRNELWLTLDAGPAS